MKTTIGTALTAVLILTACSETTDDEPTADDRSACIELDQQMLDDIAAGLNRASRGAELLSGQAVMLDEDEWTNYTTAAAIKMRDKNGEEGVVVLGLGSAFDGPITVTDEVGRRFFEWGTAAQPGSPMYDTQLDIAISDAAEEATACVE